MRVFRITGDPGLPPLALIGLADSDLGKPCTMIGCGAGKGAPVPGQGWAWGDDSTRVKRWGTGTTMTVYKVDPQSHISYIGTEFDAAAGPTTGQICIADSGCGLFVNLNGVWKLAGIGADVETDGKALFDTDLSKPGNQPDHSYFVQVRPQVPQLKKILAN